MKSLFKLSAAVSLVTALSATPALAAHHEDGKHGMAGAMKEKMHERYTAADKNGDGVISKEEFMNEAEERFKSIDADGNDELSKEEIKEHHKEKREKWKEMKEKHKEDNKEKSE